MKAMDQKSLALFNLLGFLGVILWVLVIFLRETPVAHDPCLNICLGIAPNFGVALLLPMLLANYYPVIFKRGFSWKVFRNGLAIIFAALLLSEVVHDRFLNSRFDIWDLAASLVALAIMALVARKTKLFELGA
jgi:mannose/fructose/N-acetylgalactosamine-specific phosphotransferase system component IIC